MSVYLKIEGKWRVIAEVIGGVYLRCGEADGYTRVVPLGEEPTNKGFYVVPELVESVPCSAP